MPTVAMLSPPGAKATARAMPVWALIERSWLPSAADHNRAVPSSPTETKVLPSGCQATSRASRE